MAQRVKLASKLGNLDLARGPGQAGPGQASLQSGCQCVRRFQATSLYLPAALSAEQSENKAKGIEPRHLPQLLVFMAKRLLKGRQLAACNQQPANCY